MDPDGVLVPEALPLYVHRVHGDEGGVHGVQTGLGLPGSVGGAALKADHLGDKAVAGAVGHAVFLRTAGVVSHHDVHVVQRAQAQQLALAAAITQQALPAHLLPFFDLHVLLGGYAEEDHVPVQGFGDLRVCQGKGCAHDPRRLGVVAAAVGGAGGGIGILMGGNGQAVKLAHKADHRSAAPGLEEALHACDGKPLLGVQPQGSHGGGKFSGGAVLLEAQLRMGPEILPKGDNLLPACINQAADFLFGTVHNELLSGLNQIL